MSKEVDTPGKYSQRPSY